MKDVENPMVIDGLHEYRFSDKRDLPRLESYEVDMAVSVNGLDEKTLGNIIDALEITSIRDKNYCLNNYGILFESFRVKYDSGDDWIYIRGSVSDYGCDNLYDIFKKYDVDVKEGLK